MIMNYLYVNLKELGSKMMGERKRKKRLQKYRRGGYNIASTGDAMYQYTNWCRKQEIQIGSIMEIGANYAQDAEVLQQEFKVPSCNVYVFEAHPDIYEAITKLHDFEAYQYAVTNYNGTAKFNVCSTDSANTGISSLRINTQFATREVEVPAIRMDRFIEENRIREIGFLKIDVEGCDWEVLDGFGDQLKIVKVIHIEAEHIEKWEGEKLWNDIYDKLEKDGFEMIFFERKVSQSDSFWVRHGVARGIG